MIEETLFISDLHLSYGKPAITQLFLSFLKRRAAGVDRLYILGDLFDAWVGDDDSSGMASAVAKSLRKLSEGGTAIYFQHGNRDFLIGDRFAGQAGVKLLKDYAVIDLYGTPTLLMHGDLLCTDDIAYQLFRQKSRSPEWRRKVLAKPLMLRLLLARWYRLRSYWHKRRKTAEIMDVNPQTVARTLREHKVFRLIHGHTHRPAIHDIDMNGKSAQRFVLSDWERNAGVLCWNRKEYWIEELN